MISVTFITLCSIIALAAPSLADVTDDIANGVRNTESNLESGASSAINNLEGGASSALNNFESEASSFGRRLESDSRSAINYAENGASTLEHDLESGLRDTEHFGESTASGFSGYLSRGLGTVRDYGYRGYENLPSVSSMLRAPQRILNAEIDMIDEEKNIASNIMRNPISAMASFPRDASNMMSRVYNKLLSEQ